MLESFLNAVISLSLSTATKWNLAPDVALRYAVISVVMESFGQKPPQIISGYRSPEKQMKLRDNWEAGFRVWKDVEMPAVKPACSSRHTCSYLGVPTSTAFDVSSASTGLDTFAWYWKKLPLNRWGGDFTKRDPNHFDMNVPFAKPINIC